jgi:hypothetical protein
MKKYIFLIFFISSILSATAITPIVTIDSNTQFNRNGSIGLATKTGDYIIANLTIYDFDGWQDIKKTYLSSMYGDIDCVRKQNNDNISKYTCIYTISPFMTTPTNIYIVVNTIKNLDAGNFLGNFNFSASISDLTGINIPVHPGCTWLSTCRAYEKQCTTTQLSSPIINKQCSTEIIKYRTTVQKRTVCKLVTSYTYKNITTCVNTAKCLDTMSYQFCK